MGAYPAAVLQQDGADPAGSADPAEAVVRGVLVAIDDEKIWRDLDHYEGCPAERGSPGLFRRVRTLATRADGTSTECWIYVYDCDLRSARPVAGGCWRTRGPGSGAGAGDSIPPSNR
jgi:gamma-glutamylcyclotransferase (GGCT)/AIG2-like uncharacterized protein YtfP